MTGQGASSLAPHSEAAGPGGAGATHVGGKLVHPVAQLGLVVVQGERELHHDEPQAWGMSKKFATLAASPRSPLALILPVMNIMTGLPLLVMTLVKSTGDMARDSVESPSWPGTDVHVPSAKRTVPSSAPPS